MPAMHASCTARHFSHLNYYSNADTFILHFQFSWTWNNVTPSDQLKNGMKFDELCFVLVITNIVWPHKNDSWTRSKCMLTSKKDLSLYQYMSFTINICYYIYIYIYIYYQADDLHWKREIKSKFQQSNFTRLLMDRLVYSISSVNHWIS